MRPFVIRPPKGEPLPVIVSIPHTGTAVSPEILARFASPEMAELPMTDWHLHRLYDFLPRLGVTTIFATWSRFVVDLNRPPDGQPLYPGRFETGLVPIETFSREPIFAMRPDAAEVERLRRLYHQPYHDRLAAVLAVTRERFGRVVLVDAHSIASGPTVLHDELEHDICLGNRDGESSGEWLMECLGEAFRGNGLEVVANDPYKGGFITDHYGRLSGVEAIQIEMCQRVYMDETDPAGALRHPKFAKTRDMLTDVFSRLTKRVDAELDSVSSMKA